MLELVLSLLIFVFILMFYGYRLNNNLEKIVFEYKDLEEKYKALKRENQYNLEKIKTLEEGD